MFPEAIAKLLARGITPSGMDTAAWRLIPVHIRERAFFSARVESARVLQSMRDYMQDFLAQTRMENGGLLAHSRAEFVADMRELCIREGLGNIDPATGTIATTIRESDLTEIRSLSRLQLIFDTHIESTQEYGYYTQGQAPEILDVFPAQQFIRVRPVRAPRSYHRAAEGAIRRKDDLPFWLSLNRDFGVPYGPWGFNSGMGVQDIDREEAIAAGIIRENDIVRPNAPQPLNHGLSASTADLSGDILAALRRTARATLTNGRISPMATDT